MKARLRQFVTKANTGADAIKRAPIVEHDTGVKCLRTSDVSNNNTFDRWGFCEVSDKHYKQYSLKKNDIIIARTGPIGKCYFVRNDIEAVYNNGLMRIKVDETDVFPQFVFYCLRAGHFEEYIKQVGSGSATRPNIRMDIALDYEIEKLDISNQRKIAAILSAYDDLIENNLRRIEILEEMAQLVYREWFVKFRFPGHEGVRVVDSELGMIPEGWEVKLIGEVIQTLGGSTPSTKNPQYWENGDVVWFIPTDLTKSGSMFVFDSEKKITRFGLKNSSARLFPAYSVMMTSRATIGVTAINTGEACTNQGFITCIPNDRLSLYHIYFWIQENLEKITAIASGATYKEINRTEFRSLPIVVPKDEIELIFLEVFAPIGKQIEVLLAKTANLRRTRDLLLPKLISGELDVSELDIDIGEEPA